MAGRQVDSVVKALPPDSPQRGLGHAWSATVSGNYSDDEWIGCFSQTRYFDTREQAEDWARDETEESER